MSNEVQDTGMVLKIAHLYPTLMSVAADRGNLYAIQKRCQWRGIATEVEQIYVRQTPDFTKYDLLLIHGAADREMELASRDIQLKGPALIEAAQANVVFLSICAGFQLLGHYYKPSQGPELKGVGLLDFCTEGGSTRFMTHMAMACDLEGVGKKILVGYENHSGRTWLGDNVQPLGKVIVGWGNNGKDGFEVEVLVLIQQQGPYASLGARDAFDHGEHHPAHGGVLAQGIKGGIGPAQDDYLPDHAPLAHTKGAG